jgi:hypothetical protein
VPVASGARELPLDIGHQQIGDVVTETALDHHAECVLDLAAANGFTALGGLCFLVGALLLLPRSVGSPGSGDALGPNRS